MKDIFLCILLLLDLICSFHIKTKYSYHQKSKNIYLNSNNNNNNNNNDDDDKTLKIRLRTKPEVLAPAGGWLQLKAAVENGADACYFGLQEGFNARARASNFGIDELPDVMNYLHDHGRKGYLVINVLVFDEELSNLENLVRKIAKAGVDALIMQDLGAVDLVRRLAPSLPVHGSTQMSITDANGATFVHNTLNVDRVVVGRELSIEEINKISERVQNVEIEAFVHGALCVSYSGQCYSSEAWGGRSANRGQCAQACRMPYGMIVNGTLTELRDDVQYLLSPQDLMAVDYVPELIKSGVQSFKIEGRLKGPEYVAITTKTYRQAVDEAWDLIQNNQQIDLYKGPSDELRKDLKQTFARGQDSQYDGLSAGFLTGVKHQNLVRGRSPRHRGLYAGKVLSVLSKGNMPSIVLDLEGPIKLGDGLVIDRNKPEEKEEGGSIYEIVDVGTGKKLEKGQEISMGKVNLSFGKGAIDFSRVKVGDIVWRSKDPTLEKKLKSSSFKLEVQKIPVGISLSGSVGSPLEITISCKNDMDETIYGKATTSNVIQEASKRPLTIEDINAAIGTLGDSPFVNENDIDISSLGINVFIPASQIKEARRLAIDDLIESRRKHGKDVGLVEDSVIAEMRQQAALVASNNLDNISNSNSNSNNEKENHTKPSISVLCRTPSQVKAACSIEWLDEIIVDFLEIQGLRECVEEVKAAKKTVIVATPRIIKPEEYKLFSFYVRLRPDALLVRSAGFLQQLLDLGGPGANYDHSCKIPKLYGDSFLNTANSFSAKLFLSVGLSRLAPSPDLNVNQICELARILGAEDKEAASNIEMVIHQHLPIFHTEHCVFARFLSNGDNHLNCGHPCERSHVSLRDMNGHDHLVIADQGCRNTVFNAKSQSGASFLNELLDSGIKKYRIELVDEPSEYVYDILEKYRQLLSAPTDSNAMKSLNDYLELIPNKYGLQQGSDLGSLKPSEERDRSSLKKTAYQ